MSSGDQDEPARPKARWGRRVLWVAIGLLGIVVLYLGITFIQVWQASRSDGARQADAIVVLGAAQYNGTPSPALQSRLDHALDLYQQGLAPVIVVTGGRQTGDRFTEATSGYNYLRDHGVPDGAIRKEVHGHTTYESIAAAARFLRDEDIDDVILVSSPATAERLSGISGDVGLDAAISPSGEGAPVRSLVRETAAVSIGRIIGYRRLDRFDT